MIRRIVIVKYQSNMRGIFAKYITYGDNVGSRVGLSVLKKREGLEYTSIEISQGCQVSFQLTAILLVKVMGLKFYMLCERRNRNRCEINQTHMLIRHQA